MENFTDVVPSYYDGMWCSRVTIGCDFNMLRCIMEAGVVMTSLGLSTFAQTTLYNCQQRGVNNGK